MTGNGATLFDQAVPQLGNDGGLATSLLAFTSSNGIDISLPIAWQSSGSSPAVFLYDPVTGAQQTVAPGSSAAILGGAYTVEFGGFAAVPAISFQDMPGATGNGVTVEMPEEPNGDRFLVLDGVDDSGPLLLSPGEEATTATGYTYRFVGPLEGAGINIKRDPGDTFIFLAVILALIGLAMTFYVPRRRLWARVRNGRAEIAGIAERTTRFGRELRLMGAELGSKDALLPEDDEERW